MYGLRVQPVGNAVATTRRMATKRLSGASKKLNEIVFTPSEFKNTINKPQKNVKNRVYNSGDYTETCGISYGSWLPTGIAC